jgi:pyruvate/2-oxoglutarate/acetoin dehydrogenase E1 component
VIAAPIANPTIVTRGLLQEFGSDNGMRPIVEIQFCDLLPLCMDQLASHAARYTT